MKQKITSVETGKYVEALKDPKPTERIRRKNQSLPRGYLVEAYDNRIVEGPDNLPRISAPRIMLSLTIKISPEELKAAEDTADMLIEEGYPEDEAIELALKDVNFTIEDQNAQSQNPASTK